MWKKSRPWLGALAGALLALGLLDATRLAMQQASRAHQQQPSSTSGHEEALYLYLALLIGPVVLAAGAGLGWRLAAGTSTGSPEPGSIPDADEPANDGSGQAERAESEP